MHARPRLARRRPGRRLRNKVRQIRPTARMMATGPHKDLALSAGMHALKVLFLAALEVARSERDAWLERACGQDVELRRRLDQMLAAHEKRQGLLDRHSPTTGSGEETTAAEVEPPGTMIG